jgi:hypothetical protein
MSAVSERTLLPNPDPTVLTTQQLQREILSVREILEARLNGMDKALTLLQASVDKSPTIAEINAKFTEKFESIQTQFKERDTRTEQTAKDSKVAVDAALQAAKEAVGEQNKSSALAIAKSETSTTKQIDGIVSLIASGTKAQDDKLGDVKDRLGAIENRRKGASDGWGYIVGAIGLLCVVIGTVLSIFAVVKK